jgi:hypothetical protein
MTHLTELMQLISERKISSICIYEELSITANRIESV